MRTTSIMTYKFKIKYFRFIRGIKGKNVKNGINATDASMFMVYSRFRFYFRVFPMTSTHIKRFIPLQQTNEWSDPSLLFSIWYSQYPATKPAPIRTINLANKRSRNFTCAKSYIDCRVPRKTYIALLVTTLNS